MSNQLATTQAAITNADLAPLFDMVTNGMAANTKRSYERALNDFLVWYQQSGQTTLNKATVNAHKDSLLSADVPASSINQRLTAIKKLAQESADNGLIDEKLFTAIKRVKGIKQTGAKLGTWLDKEQSAALINAPRIIAQQKAGAGKFVNECKYLRDRAILAIMVGCGLRREEVCRLTVGHFQRVPTKSGRKVWVIKDLSGKHGKTRTVSVNSWVKSAINEWLKCAQIESGEIFLGISKGGKIADKAMTPQAIWNLVSGYSAYVPNYDDDGNQTLGMNIAPHDLRRTFARLAYAGGATIEQIQQELGHDSRLTTEKYLGLQMDLDNSASGAISIEL